jgi:hypothetical protein
MFSTRWLVWAAALGALFGSANLFPVRAAESAEERALRLIDCAGGAVIRDEAVCGQPVIAVSLCGSTVNDDLLKSLAAFPQLRTLDLCRTEGLTSKRARFLADLKELETLNVSRCPNVTGHGLYKLSALKNLRVLDVSYCPEIDDCGLEALTEYFPKVRALDISGCTAISARGLRELRELKTLEVLTAANCDFNDDALKEIAAMKQLRSLSLRGSQRAGVNGFRALATLENLEAIDLSDSNVVSSAVIMPLFQKLTKLHTVSIANCPRLANHSLRAFRSLKELRTLNIAGFPHLEAYGIEYLVQAAPNLRAIDMTGSEVDDEAMKVLVKMSQLERLDVRGCKHVSASGAKVLTDALPKLKLDR